MKNVGFVLKYDMIGSVWNLKWYWNCSSMAFCLEGAAVLTLCTRAIWRSTLGGVLKKTRKKEKILYYIQKLATYVGYFLT
jgi:hypothetical protein